MNKSIILSAMLALSMPALAADVLYVSGDDSQTINGNTPNWNYPCELQVPISEDGNFYIDVNGFKDIQISTAAGTNWDTFAAGAYRIVGWDRGVKINDTSTGTFPGKFVGNVNSLEPSTASMLGPDYGMAGDYTFVIDKDVTQCRILPHAIYLYGPASVEINGTAFASAWNIVDPVKISKSNGEFKFNVKITGGNQVDFCISTTTPVRKEADGGETVYRGWEFYNLGQFSATINNETLNTSVTLAHNDNGNKSQQFTFAADVPAGDYTVTITEDMSKVTVTEKAAPAVTTLYVNGDVGQTINDVASPGWTTVNPVEVQLKDGKFTIKVDNFSNIGISAAKSQTSEEEWTGAWDPHKINFKTAEGFAFAKPLEAVMNVNNSNVAFDAGTFVGTKGGSFTLIIPEDLSTITVLPNQLYLAGEPLSTVDGTNLGKWDIINPRKIDLDEENGVFAFTYYTKANYNIDLSVLWANSGSADWTTWGKGKFSTDGSKYTAENVNTRQSLINNKTSQMVMKEGTYNVAVARDMSYVILCENTEGTIDTGTENYYATFSNPYSDIELDGNGIEVYNVTVSGDQLVLTKRSDNKVAKGEGVLVKVSTDATITVKPIDAGLTASESENYLVPTPVTAGTVSEPGYKLYRLAYNDFTNKTGLGFYLGNDDGSITYTTAKPYKAYLKVPTAQAAQIKKFLLNPQPTHVDGINVNEQETDKAIYDISGRRVENPTPGFYIQGNKKIVIR